MNNVIRMTMFKKIHIPNSPVRVEVLQDEQLLLSFPKEGRPDVVCKRADLPKWFAGKLAYLEERVSIFEPCEYGARMDDNIFYIDCI